MKKNNFNYRLYGRSKGRKKKYNIDELYKKFKIEKINPLNYNIIDIGPGYGESSIELAKFNKENNIIACEKYLDGIKNLLDKKQKDSLNNLFIYKGNAHQLIDEYCDDNSISEIWVLFPDPWPKKRHFKRRLIDLLFFKKIYRILKKNASIHIASDSKSYIAEILQCVFKVKNHFLWVNQSKEEWNYSNLSLPKTKYFKKALESGYNSFYIKLMKL